MQSLARSAPFAILFCAAVYLFTLTLDFEFPRAPGRLGPDIWPRIVLVLLMIACGVGILKSFLARERSEPAVAQPPAARGVTLPGDLPAEDEDAPSRYGLVVAGFLLFLIYPIALEYLGFLVATFLLMALFMLVGQWFNVPAVLGTSAIGTLALFYIFRGIVYVSLPLGTGPFQTFTLRVAELLGMR